jgi:hypothetical protein
LAGFLDAGAKKIPSEITAYDAVFRAKWFVHDAHLALKYRAAESASCPWRE